MRAEDQSATKTPPPSLEPSARLERKTLPSTEGLDQSKIDSAPPSLLRFGSAVPLVFETKTLRAMRGE